MSADNGVYIAKFPTKDGFEYRVAHHQAIENCDDCGMYSKRSQDQVDAYRAMYFADAPVFTNEDEAILKAHEIYDQYLEEGKNFGAYIEYGVSSIEFDRPLNGMTTQEARQWIDDYWKKRGK